MSPRRIYVYIDGENHYQRSLGAIRQCAGDNASFGQLLTVDDGMTVNGGVISSGDGARFLYDPNCLLFWDTRLLTPYGHIDRSLPRPSRVYYITSMGSAENEINSAKVKLRSFGFDPLVVREVKSHRQNRAQTLVEGVLDKAKGCDILLATTALLDAANDRFDECMIFTSDRDFLPLVESIRSLGKRVVLCGYACGLGKDSPFLYCADLFHDLQPEIQRLLSQFVSQPTTDTNTM